MESIGEYAFEGCSSRKKINISSSVNEIGQGAFCDCESITELAFPDGITILNIGVCFSSEKLECVTIPKSVTKIDFYAFANCDSLRKIIYNGTIDDWNKIDIDSEAFDDDNKQLVVEFASGEIMLMN